MDIQKLQDRLRLKGIRIKPDDSALHLIALNEIVLDGILNKYSNELFALTGTSMDIDAMRTLLLEKGIRVAHDDPIFILMAVNEIVLEDIAVTCRKKISKVDKLIFTLTQPNLRAYFKVFAPFALVSVGAVLVTHDLLRQGLVLLLGGTIGAAFCLFYLDRVDRLGGVMSSLRQTNPETVPAHDNSSHWSSTEFDQVVRKVRDSNKHLSSRSLEACKAVLVHGESVGDAAARTSIPRSQVTRAIGILNDARK